jgi:hypothetical protein
MQTLFLTMPELERAARRWAADFLHEGQNDAVPVMVNLRGFRDEQCEDRNIIIFQRAPAEVVSHVLHNGGRPWLVTDPVPLGAYGTYHPR